MHVVRVLCASESVGRRACGARGDHGMAWPVETCALHVLVVSCFVPLSTQLIHQKTLLVVWAAPKLCIHCDRVVCVRSRRSVASSGVPGIPPATNFQRTTTIGIRAVTCPVPCPHRPRRSLVTARPRRRHAVESWRRPPCVAGVIAERSSSNAS